MCLFVRSVNQKIEVTLKRSYKEKYLVENVVGKPLEHQEKNELYAL